MSHSLRHPVTLYNVTQILYSRGDSCPNGAAYWLYVYGITHLVTHGQLEKLALNVVFILSKLLHMELYLGLVPLFVLAQYMLTYITSQYMSRYIALYILHVNIYVKVGVAT